MDLTRMTLHSFKLPTSNNTVFYIPPRFLKSKTAEKNYKQLMAIFIACLKKSGLIVNSITKLEKPTESEVSLKLRIMTFKDLVMTYRQKYVVATWRPEDSERLHNEMTVDISNLVKEHSEIGKLWRQVKALRK